MHSIFGVGAPSTKYDAIFCLDVCFGADLEKKRTPWNLQNSIFKEIFPKFVKFSAKIGSLNVQIRNIIFIACKWSKICKYHVNSRVISCSTCQKEERECTWVKYFIYAIFQFVLIYAFCSTKSVFLKFQSSHFFPQVCLGGWCRIVEYAAPKTSVVM